MVTKISSQCPSVLRMVEWMIDVTKISDPDQSWQRSVEQFLDDTRHEPISRISASIRILRRILCLSEKIRQTEEKMIGVTRGEGAVRDHRSVVQGP